MSNPRTETNKLGVGIRPPYRFPDTGHLPKTVRGPKPVARSFPKSPHFLWGITRSSKTNGQ